MLIMFGLLSAGCAGPAPVTDSNPKNPATEAATPQSSVVADPHQQAAAAYRQKDYQQVLALMEPLAMQGDANAEYIIGYMYFNGYGVKANPEVARQWIERSAVQGNKNANTALDRIRAAAEQEKRAAEEQAQRDLAFQEEESFAAQDSFEKASNEPASWVTAFETSNSQLNSVEKTDHAVGEKTLAGTPQTLGEGNPDSELALTSEQMKLLANPNSEITVQPQNINKMSVGTESNDSPTVAIPVPENSQAGDKKYGSDWILKQPPTNYTIQLMAGADKQAILSFIGRQEISPQAVYFVFEGNELPLYAAIYGSFSGYSLAQQALDNLGTGVRTKSAWIRDFASIQRILISEEELQ